MRYIVFHMFHPPSRLGGCSPSAQKWWQVFAPRNRVLHICAFYVHLPCQNFASPQESGCARTGPGLVQVRLRDLRLHRGRAAPSAEALHRAPPDRRLQRSPPWPECTGGLQTSCTRDALQSHSIRDFPSRLAAPRFMRTASPEGSIFGSPKVIETFLGIRPEQLSKKSKNSKTSKYSKTSNNSNISKDSATCKDSKTSQNSKAS